MKSVFGFRVRLGNPDLDFENLNPDFPIERTLAFLFFYRWKKRGGEECCVTTQRMASVAIVPLGIDFRGPRTTFDQE